MARQKDNTARALEGKGSALTEGAYWDSNYSSRTAGFEIALDGFRNYPARKVYELLAGLLKPGMKVLEIGAGDSPWPTLLAERFPDVSITGLDYSPVGIQRLRERARKRGVAVEVVEADLFRIPEPMRETYDLVFSLGVVEHFQDLAEVLRAVGGFVKPGGIVLSIIPNMNWTLGFLTKHLNRDVYRLHNCLDLPRFVTGHEMAGFKTERSGYFLSSNYGVLSSCVTEGHSIKYRLYLFLSRVSKALWALEARGFPLPASRWFSPYIHYIGKKGA